jgi:hypothetical protein
MQTQAHTHIHIYTHTHTHTHIRTHTYRHATARTNIHTPLQQPACRRPPQITTFRYSRRSKSTKRRRSEKINTGIYLLYTPLQTDVLACNSARIYRARGRVVCKVDIDSFVECAKGRDFMSTTSEPSSDNFNAHGTFHTRSHSQDGLCQLLGLVDLTIRQ